MPPQDSLKKSPSGLLIDLSVIEQRESTPFRQLNQSEQPREDRSGQITQ